jgi:rare lipoprotein A
MISALALVAALSCAKPQAPPRFNPPVGSTHADKPKSGPGPGLDFAKHAESHPDTPPEVGMASWYGAELAGHKTASGERFDPGAFTAAHRTLKLGTWVEVRRVDTGRSIRVRINDRGPTRASRVIDLSRRAAEALDMLREGVAKVELRVVSGPE